MVAARQGPERMMPASHNWPSTVLLTMKIGMISLIFVEQRVVNATDKSHSGGGVLFWGCFEHDLTTGLHA